MINIFISILYYYCECMSQMDGDSECIVDGFCCLVFCGFLQTCVMGLYVDPSQFLLVHRQLSMDAFGEKVLPPYHHLIRVLNNINLLQTIYHQIGFFTGFLLIPVLLLMDVCTFQYQNVALAILTFQAKNCLPQTEYCYYIQLYFY